MQRNFRDWGGNLVAFAVVILLNVLSNALPINGQTMPEISAKYPSLFTPAGFTFSIWGVIYLALLAFVVWQALPAQRTNAKIARLSRLIPGQLPDECHLDRCLALRSARAFPDHHARHPLDPGSHLSRVCSLKSQTHLLPNTWSSICRSASIRAGSCVATIANASALQTGNGWDDIWLTAIQWALLKLAVAGAIGAHVVLRYRDPVFASVIVWAAYGISAKQSAILPSFGRGDRCWHY